MYFLKFQLNKLQCKFIKFIRETRKGSKDCVGNTIYLRFHKVG